MKKWLLKNSKPIFTSKYIGLKENTYQLPDGSICDDYYLIDRPDYVLILAEDKNGRILIEKNYRPGPDDFVIELPAGWINQGESPQDAANRELREETGWEGTPIYLGAFYLAPSFSAIKGHVVYITNLKRIGDPEVNSLETPHSIFLDKNELIKHIQDQAIKEIGIIAALNMLWNKSD
jgi:8-oxo-dGTP pyrophosphatase MutT (NUDIX family)